MALALRAPISALPLGGDILTTFIEVVLSRLNREGLTAEEREHVTKVKEATELFGTYVLGAQDREDLVVRIDTLIEDPAFHRALFSTFDYAWSHRETLAEDVAATATSSGDTHSAFEKALGPAAKPYLQEIHRYMIASAEMFRHAAKAYPKEAIRAALDSFTDEDADPLGFLSDPSMPVPIARGLLAMHRSNAFVLSAGAAVLSGPIENWLGLAIAELWAEQTREFISMAASLPGFEISPDLVPLHLRHNLKQIEERAKAVRAAYEQFNADAERSGESIYPSTS